MNLPSTLIRIAHLAKIALRAGINACFLARLTHGQTEKGIIPNDFSFHAAFLLAFRAKYSSTCLFASFSLLASHSSQTDTLTYQPPQTLSWQIKKPL